MIVVESPHQFYYDTAGKVTAKSLAESLLGLEAIVKHSVRASCKYAGLKSKDIEVIIDSVTISSYKDDFLVRVIFGNADQVDEKIDALRKVLGLNKLDELLTSDDMRAKTLRTILGIGIAGSILYGSYLWLSPDEKNDPTMQVTISNSFNNIGADANLSGEEVQKIISSALTPGKVEDFKRDTVKLLSPGGQTEGGTVTIDGKENYVIPAEIIDTVPTQYEKPERDDPFELKNNIEISIRALDLDKPDQGWHAVIEDITERRVKLTLAEGIDPNKLPIGKTFKADVVIVYKETTRGKTAKEYQLVKSHQ